MIPDLTEKGRIVIIDKDNIRHQIIVPAGMMSDIVKPLWEERVVVTGLKRGKQVFLEDIQREGEE